MNHWKVGTAHCGHKWALRTIGKWASSGFLMQDLHPMMLLLLLLLLCCMLWLLLHHHPTSATARELGASRCKVFLSGLQGSHSAGELGLCALQLLQEQLLQLVDLL